MFTLRLQSSLLVQPRSFQECSRCNQPSSISDRICNGILRERERDPVMVRRIYIVYSLSWFSSQTNTPLLSPKLHMLS